MPQNKTKRIISHSRVRLSMPFLFRFIRMPRASTPGMFVICLGVCESLKSEPCGSLGGRLRRQRCPRNVWIGRFIYLFSEWICIMESAIFFRTSCVQRLVYSFRLRLVCADAGWHTRWPCCVGTLSVQWANIEVYKRAFLVQHRNGK